MQVNVLEAKTQLSKLLDSVESGRETEVVIARNGRPVARLVPLEARRPVRLGLADGEFPPSADPDDPEVRAEIDRMFAAHRILPDGDV